MRMLVIALAIMSTSAAAWPQQAGGQSPLPEKTYTSAAEITTMIAKARSERKEGQANVLQNILHLAPYNANLEYRASVGTGSVHEREAEFFYVIDGSATMVVGGKLVNESRSNPDNLTGTGIEGGTPRKVSKGDFIVVPENTAHWFSAIDTTLVLMTLHVPRPAPAAK